MDAHLHSSLFGFSVFLLPLVISQILVGAWLLFIRARTSASCAHSVLLATDVLRSAGIVRGAFRAPRLLVARIAQPILVSLFGKPFLVLPQQGLAYFQHYLEEGAEAAFRSVIAHELGHLSAWDDVLFICWFSYFSTGVVGGVLGTILAATHTIAMPSMLADDMVLICLFWLGMYVLRRRESYSDAYSVVLMSSEAPSRSALEALQASKWHTSLATSHFNPIKRIIALDERGRSLLGLSQIDLGLLAFLYFSWSGGVVPIDRYGWNPAAFASVIVDAAAIFFLQFFLLLAIAGSAVRNEGVPPRLSKLVVAGLICTSAIELRTFLSLGIFNPYAWFVQGLSAFVNIIPGTIAFVFIIRIFNRWSVATIAGSKSNTAEYLAWRASIVVFAFTLASLAGDLLFSVLTRPSLRGIANSDGTYLANLFNAPLSEGIRWFAPIFLGLIATPVFRAAILLAIYVWASLKIHRTQQIACSSCGHSLSQTLSDRMLLQSCPYCGALLRPDLFTDLGAERA